MKADFLIRGATVYDGSGRPPEQADVAVAGDRIFAVGPDAASAGAGRTIDADGLALAPGFIDMHSHADFTLPSYPRAVNSISQGVTTEVTGNCGFSPAPLSPDPKRVDLARGWGRGIGPDLDWEWRSFAEYLHRVEAAEPAVNVAQLVGFGALRIAAAGIEDRAATPAEVEEMRRLLDESLAAGAWGMSTGLVYPPASFAGTDEIVAVGAPLTAVDGLYASHIRGEYRPVVEAVDEALEIGERLGVRVQLSHLKATGPINHGRIRVLLDRIEAAQARGMRVNADAYPYNGGSSMLLILLPPWVYEGGVDQTIERLRVPEQRARIRHDMEHGVPGWDNEIETVGGWSGVLIAGVLDPSLRGAQGRWVSDLAAEARQDPLDFVFDFLVRDRCGTMSIGFGVREEDNATALRHPAMAIGSDQGAVNRRDAQVHPRCYGAFVRVLGPRVRDERLFSLEEAVRKMTGLPAAIMGMHDRGRVEAGAAADLVIFDPATVTDRATFEEPTLLAQGIEHVFLGGTPAVDGGLVTGEGKGRVLRRPSATK